MVAGAPVAAGLQAGEIQLTPEELADIKLIDRALGVDQEQLTASRAAAAKGEAGVIGVKRLERVRLAARAARKAG
jgi:HPt (histidine-containing phosphotransfer) domain-containing protein